MRMSLNVEKTNWEVFSDYQVFVVTNKIDGISPQYSSTSIMFEVEFSKEEFELVLAEVFMFEYWTK